MLNFSQISYNMLSFLQGLSSRKNIDENTYTYQKIIKRYANNLCLNIEFNLKSINFHFSILSQNVYIFKCLFLLSQILEQSSPLPTSLLIPKPLKRKQERPLTQNSPLHRNLRTQSTSPYPFFRYTILCQIFYLSLNETA